MGRQKKIKVVQVNENEVNMTETNEMALEVTQQEIDNARLELENIKKEIEEKKQELKLSSRREITENEKEIIEKQVNNINKNKNRNDVIERQKEIDKQMIKGRFMNRRAPGQSVKLTYNKYADDPVKWYIFEDGGIYTIPRGFVDQINEYYHTPVFIQKQGPQMLSEKEGENSVIAEVDTSNKKYAFVPIGFAA